MQRFEQTAQVAHGAHKQGAQQPGSERLAVTAGNQAAAGLSPSPDERLDRRPA